MLPIPERIKSMIDLTQRCYDQIGQSDSTVIFFGDKVLKISRESVESWQEMHMMQWLSGKIPVPDVLCTEKYHRLDYLLMTRLPGVMACDAYYLARPKELTAILAEGLKMLWSVKDTGCGYNCNLYKKLRMAHHNVRHDKVDLDSRVFAMLGEKRFVSPEHLFNWLLEHRPEEEPVLSHGDFCLPNIFIQNGKISGFVDLGRAGIADKYQDIALCYRSLRQNCKKFPEAFDPDCLFEMLDIKPDWEKIRYYILLDELF